MAEVAATLPVNFPLSSRRVQLTAIFPTLAGRMIGSIVLLFLGPCLRIAGIVSSATRLGGHS